MDNTNTNTRKLNQNNEILAYQTGIIQCWQRCGENRTFITSDATKSLTLKFKIISLQNTMHALKRMKQIHIYTWYFVKNKNQVAEQYLQSDSILKLVCLFDFEAYDYKRT